MLHWANKTFSGHDETDAQVVVVAAVVVVVVVVVGVAVVMVTAVNNCQCVYQRWNRVSGSQGQQFGSGSGRVTGQSPDPAF